MGMGNAAHFADEELKSGPAELEKAMWQDNQGYHEEGHAQQAVEEGEYLRRVSEHYHMWIVHRYNDELNLYLLYSILQ